MDKNNTNDANNMKRNPKTSATTPPNWDAPTTTGMPRHAHGSRKLYVLLTMWGILLTAAVAAATSDCADESAKQGTAPKDMPEAFRMANPSDGTQHRTAPSVAIDTTRLDHSLPGCFRNTRPNRLVHPERLNRASQLIAEGQRPLRVLQIGDSHVAGKSFPQALKEALTSSLGAAPSAEEGTGVWFRFFGSNGATSARFLTDAYMERFAETQADLIIVSLGTNEAHGMGYREDAHDRQLDRFFERLKEACPDAEIVMTTPPGDYLTTHYVNYRSTSRKSRRKVRVVRYARRPNPMSARCAENIMNYADNHGMAAWNLFEIAGGGDGVAQRNWVSAHMMRQDRIHFEPSGYRLQGRLLGNAIVCALAARHAQ